MSETKEKAGKLKVKRPKKLVKTDEPIKVDLSKPVEKTEEEIPINKYAPKDKLGKPLLGRSPNYVTSVGLGKLNVVHAKGVKDNGNS